MAYQTYKPFFDKIASFRISLTWCLCVIVSSLLLTQQSLIDDYLKKHKSEQWQFICTCFDNIVWRWFVFLSMSALSLFFCVKICTGKAKTLRLFINLSLLGVIIEHRNNYSPSIVGCFTLWHLCFVALFIVCFVEGSQIVRELINRSTKEPLSSVKNEGFAVATEEESLIVVGWKEYVDNLISLLHKTNVREECFAVGVTGSWGSGKTEFLKEIRERLNPQTRVIDFAPWNCLNAQQLVSNFFVQLEQSICCDSIAANAIFRYAKAIQQLEVLPTAANRLLSVLVGQQEESILQIKNEVQKTLADLEHPIVVLIDDLDRLNKSELFEVFRLIRITANFRNVIFFATYDVKHVTRMLTELGIDENYKKKIFDIEVTLPSFEPYVYPQLLYNELKRVVKDETILESLRDVIFSKIQTKSYFICNYLENFRDIKRFANAFMANLNAFLARNKVGDFYITEFFVLELLKYSSPDCYESLRQNRFLYLKAKTNTNACTIYELDEDKTKHLVEKDLLILKALFEPKRERPANSITLYSNFDNYFSYRVIDTHISTIEYYSLLENGTEYTLRTSLANWCETNSEKRQSLLHLMYKTYPNELDTIKACKNYLLLLFNSYKYFSEKIHNQLVRDKIDSQLYRPHFDEAVCEELASYCMLLIEERIDKYKDLGRVNTLLSGIYSEITYNDEGEDLIEYQSILKNEQVQMLSEKCFRQALLKNKPAITEISRRGSRFRKYIANAVTLTGYELYPPNQLDPIGLYKNLLIEELKCQYTGTSKADFNEFIKPFAYSDDDFKHGIEEDEHITDVHEEWIGLFGSLHAYEDFVQTCFDLTDEERERYFKQWNLNS